MTIYRRMAAKVDQHMQQLEVLGMTEPLEVINRMMDYTTELHQIWTGTTYKEQAALTQEYPGFYRYALIIETAFKHESQKPFRFYDGMPEFSRANKHSMEQALTTAATLERGYLTYQGNPLPLFDEQIIRLGESFMLWQECVNAFRKVLNADENVTPMQRKYVYAGLTTIFDRLGDVQAKRRKHI